MRKNCVFAVLLACCFMLASCSSGKPEDIVGVWKTENVGYYTVTTFNEDNTFYSVYSVSDRETAEAYGITQELLDAMNSEGFYTIVPQGELSDEEKNQADGRFAIRVYATAEDMNTEQNGSLSFYAVNDEALALDGCAYYRIDR